MPITAGTRVIDASVAINLLATRHGRDVLAAVSNGVVMESRAAGEIIRHPRALALPQGPLTELRQGNLLRIVELPESDLDLFLELAGAPSPDGLDDGEAASLALAARYGGALVVDERKARRICTQEFPSVEVVSSVGLFRNWAQNASAPQVKEALLEAQRIGRMRIIPDEQAWFDSAT